MNELYVITDLGLEIWDFTNITHLDYLGGFESDIFRVIVAVYPTKNSEMIVIEKLFDALFLQVFNISDIRKIIPMPSYYFNMTMDLASVEFL